MARWLSIVGPLLGVGVDPNFNDTPGLLLSVDVPNLVPRRLSTFLGDGVEKYLEYPPEHSVLEFDHLARRDERVHA